MYVPKHFQVTDESEVFAFIQSNAFGQLISCDNGKPLSTHLPFLLSENNTKLFSHLARPNTHWKVLDGQEVLITLQGPHDYISPSWYAGPGVPTWNYQAVHIYGHCQVFSDVDKLKWLVDSISNKYEANFSEPWQPEYKASMLKAIVGVEIAIDEVQCQFKLSQNRSEEDQRKVIQQLQVSGSNNLAAAMEKVNNIR